MKQWSANCGTSVSATRRSVSSSSSELPSRSPIRSSSPGRPVAPWVPTWTACLAMITVPATSPETPRSGAAFILTKKVDPSGRLIASVPSQSRPRQA